MKQQQAAVWVIMALLVVGLFSLIPRQGQAQPSGDSSCPALVELALSEVGNNCADLPRNSACYGFNRVNSTFAETVANEFFSRPADRAALASMKTIQTSALDLDLGEWGVAVLNVQANVPDTLPGQAVTFLLMGDTQVENAVKGDGAGGGQAITVITQVAADLRSAPDLGSAVLVSLAAGTVLQADAVSEDGRSLHVLTDTASGWIDVSAVNATPQIAALTPNVGGGGSPMQAFYFRTGPGQTTCNQTPNVLAIQSPENIKVDLTANGANIRLGSLITLEVLPPGNLMKLTTLEGNALLNPDTPEEVNVPAGFTTTRCLKPPDNLGLDGESNDQEVGEDCQWEPPKQADINDLDKGQIVQAMLERLALGSEATPEPEATETPAPETTETPAASECPTGTTITHVVSPGENLFRISLRYSTGMGAIMQANGLTDPEVIFAGQVLTIPCGVDTGLPTIPDVPGVTPGVVIVGVDCAPFRATSPLDGLNHGSTTFYWDAAPGATSYRVNLYNLDEKGGALVGSFTTAAPQTNLTADLSVQNVGYGFSFAWEVQALVNGQVGCSSARFNVPRAPAPNAGPPGFTASWGCLPTGSTFVINYANLPAGTVRLTFTFSGFATPGSPHTISNPPPSGSLSFFASGPISGGAVIANPSGATVVLSPASLGTCP